MVLLLVGGFGLLTGGGARTHRVRGEQVSDEEYAG
jgi:hypothetical protein